MLLTGILTHLQKIVKFSPLFLAVLACSNEPGPLTPQKNPSTLKEKWQPYDAPPKIGLPEGTYRTEFSSLPTQGRLTRIPWSSSYWPSFKGGVSYRWNYGRLNEREQIFYNTIPFASLRSVDVRRLSPAEKYDIFLGDERYGTTNRERQRTNVFKRLHGGVIPEWDGLCHAWAPATLFFENPAPVTLESKSGIKVAFGSADVQALLTLFLHEMSSPIYFASLRCNVNEKALRIRMQRGEITREEYLRQMNSPECKGINAGAFHIILANMIGIKNEGFIIDKSRDAEVWNQPVNGYSSRVLQERTTGISSQAAPGTVKEVRLETKVIYTSEIPPMWERAYLMSGNRELTYLYWVELDANNRIIGGNWETWDQPDFLWRRTINKGFNGRFAPLQAIYEASIRNLQPRGPSFSMLAENNPLVTSPALAALATVDSSIMAPSAIEFPADGSLPIEPSESSEPSEPLEAETVAAPTPVVQPAVVSPERLKVSFKNLKWNSHNQIIHYTMSVSGQAPDGVNKVLFKMLSPEGREMVQQELVMDHSNNFSYSMRDSKLHKGHFALIGIDRDGKTVIEDFHAF